MTDSLLKKIASGDQAAVDACVDRYGRMIWSIALKMSGDRAEAEDGVQEVFIDLWRHASRFDPAFGTEPAFVATIARRRMIDRMRKQSRRPCIGSRDVNQLVEQQLTGPRAEIVDEALRVRQSMNQLKPEERSVLELAILDGLSQHAIAEKLEMPLGTVKSHARRGMRRLKDINQSSESGAAL